MCTLYLGAIAASVTASRARTRAWCATRRAWLCALTLTGVRFEIKRGPLLDDRRVGLLQHCPECIGVYKAVAIRVAVLVFAAVNHDLLQPWQVRQPGRYCARQMIGPQLEHHQRLELAELWRYSPGQRVSVHFQLQQVGQATELSSEGASSWFQKTQNNFNDVMLPTSRSCIRS